MSFTELQRNVELILLRDSPLNGFVAETVDTPQLSSSTGVISLIGLNPIGEIIIEYTPLRGNSLLSVEYYKSDESIAKLLIQFLAESICEVLGLETKYSVAHFLHDLRDMDISKHMVITDAAINSARYCEFNDYKEIEKGIPDFFNSDSLSRRDFKLVSEENPDWERNRAILYNDKKTELSYQHVIYSKKEGMFFRFLYAVDDTSSKFVIGKVNKYYPLPFGSTIYI